MWGQRCRVGSAGAGEREVFVGHGSRSLDRGYGQGSLRGGGTSVEVESRVCSFWLRWCAVFPEQELRGPVRSAECGPVSHNSQPERNATPQT